MAASFSQALSTFVIPSAQPSDPESVRGSLAQAHAEFERGAVREALRLLRKAAEGSDEAGDDMRAVALARAAADLATEVGPAAVSAAPPAPASLPAALSAAPPPPPAPLPPPASVAPAPTSLAPAPAPTPALASAVASPLPVPAAAAPVPAALSAAPASPPMSPAAPAAPTAPTASTNTTARSAPSARLADPSLQQLLDSGRAVKVVVKRSSRDEGLYVVRLADGNPPSLGTREAVLLLVDPDAGFFTPPKA